MDQWTGHSKVEDQTKEPSASILDFIIVGLLSENASEGLIGDQHNGIQMNAVTSAHKPLNDKKLCAFHFGRGPFKKLNIATGLAEVENQGGHQPA